MDYISKLTFMQIKLVVYLTIVKHLKGFMYNINQSIIDYVILNSEISNLCALFLDGRLYFNIQEVCRQIHLSFC